MPSKYFYSAIVALVATSATSQPISDIYPFPGYAYPLDPVAEGACVPTDINDAGQVVGFNYYNVREYESIAFVTGPNGLGSTTLTLGGKDSTATAINNKGQVVGVSDIKNSDIQYHAFITDPDGTNIRPIGPAGARATAINDLGQVAGDLGGVAYLTGPNGQTPKFIDSLGTFTTVSGVNHTGQLAGLFTDQGSIRHAFVTGPDGLGMVDLNLPGSTFSAAVDINELGQVTGDQWIGEIGHREQYFAASNGLSATLLGTLDNLPGGRSEGGGLNNSGTLVGISSRGDKYGRIYVTFVGKDGEMKNLNKYVKNLPVGVYLTSNPVINNRNQIAAQATDGRCYLVCPNKRCE